MSTLKVDTIQDTNAVEMYLCKAWVNFNGQLAAASMIRDSGNVSSITDNGTGNYTVNFTNAMPDSNFSALVTSGDHNVGNFLNDLYTVSRTSSSVQIYCSYGTSATAYDVNTVQLAIFR